MQPCRGVWPRGMLIKKGVVQNNKHPFLDHSRKVEESKMDSHRKQLLKLSEESLMKEPEDVFDLLEKIGEG